MVNALLKLLAAGLRWVLRRTTSLSPRAAEHVANGAVIGLIVAVCSVAWLMYLTA